MSANEVSKDIFDFDGRLLDALKQRLDTINSFAIQNYAACGAIAFFKFNSNNTLPLWLAAAIVLLLCFNFVLAIAANLFVAKKLYAMHRVTQNCWFEGKSRAELRTALEEDGKGILDSKEFPRGYDFKHPSILANLVPAVGVLAILIASSYYPEHFRR